MGIISIRQMQQIIVWLAERLKYREIIGQTKAPAIPEEVAVMERSAIATVPIFNSVLANRIAVPETVAIASERRNHATRNTTHCRS